MNLSFSSRAARGSVFALPIAATFAVALGGGVGTADAKTAAKPPKNKPVTLTVGFIGGAASQATFPGPEGFAYSKGLLQKWLKPDKITIKSTAGFANGPLLTAALVGGSVQLGELGDTPALIAESPVNSSGDNTRFINQYAVGNQSVLISQSSITATGALAGKGIYRQPQSYMDRWVQAYLQSLGLLGKMSLAPGLLAQFIPEFNNGQIPDLVLPPSDLPLITAKYNTLESSSDTPQWNGTGVTEVTKSVLAQDPGLPASWNAARDLAIRYAKAHAAAYYAFEAKSQGTTVAAATKYYPLSDSPLAAFTASGLTHLKGTLAFLVAQKEATNFTISDWQTPIGG